MTPTQYLTFQLAGEEYAIEILPVREIIAYGPMTAVPHAPPSLRGVINLRGSVVPVVDLAVKFGLRATPLTNRTSIVILEIDLHGESTVIGILADAVNQVVEWHADDIVPVPGFGTLVPVDFLRGLGKAGARFVFILEIGRALAAAESFATPAALAVSRADSADTPDASISR
ncbi:MAG TPA: chemotaxis protein CheW [Candidatus Limnocylindria bacterium]|nr:chemotaxis protein CheW [Candidatus Limnocylindria bacterium]